MPTSITEFSEHNRGYTPTTERISTRLILKSEGRILIVRKNEIDWLEAKVNHVLLHLRNETHCVRSTMLKLEEELDPFCFLRISRSAMVNLDFILELKPWLRGSYRVLLRDGTELLMNRNHLERLYSLICRPIGVRNRTL